MKRIFPIVVSFALVNAKSAMANSLDRQIGIVVAKASLVCLIASAQNLKTGSKVSLVLPTIPQRLVSGTVTSTYDRKCAQVSKPYISGKYYRLSLPYSHTQIDLPAIAILNADSHLHRVVLRVVGDLDGDGTAELFRSCASSEGIHLTVWSDRPLIGIRRWHSYYYLGYDVEPTRTKLEYDRD